MPAGDDKPLSRWDHALDTVSNELLNLPAAIGALILFGTRRRRVEANRWPAGA